MSKGTRDINFNVEDKIVRNKERNEVKIGIMKRVNSIIHKYK